MSKEQILGLIRHFATAVGGALIISGKTDEAMVQASVGSLLTIVGMAWSFWEKRSRK